MSALYEIRKTGKLYSQLKEKLNEDKKTRVNESVGRDQCVALKDIKKGTLILKGTKEMVPEGNSIGSPYDVQKLVMNILKAFKKMKKSDQDEFLTLRNKYEDEEILQSVPELQHHVKIWLSFFKELDQESIKKNVKIIGIYSTHAFGDEGLCMKMAHFNHSCKPNADAIGDASVGGIIATKKIKAGEEITVNHLGAYSCILMLNRKRRQHIIEQTRHFVCSCDFCEVDIDDPTTNYKKLEEMIKEEENLRNDLKLALLKTPYFNADNEDVFHQGFGDNPNPSKQYKNEWDFPFVHRVYPIEKCKKHLEIIHLLFNHGREKKAQPLGLYGLVNAGYESSMIAYGLSADHRNYRKRFKDEAMTFAQTAEKFEKLLPKEVTNSNLGFEIWRIAQKRLEKPLVYMKFK